MSRVKTGIEVLKCTDAYDEIFKNKRLALITNPTGVDHNFVSTIDILNEKYDLRILLSPEHGVRGDAAAGASIDNYIDEKTNLPVYSLYGESRHLSSKLLDQFDVLVYDIQDVGCRYYTYIYTLLNAMEDCHKADKTVVVLDRPNPLGGIDVEGNILEDEYLSFVGGFQMPVKYALTVGEFALMLKDKLNLASLDLEIVKMENWKRHMLYEDTGLYWVSPSPNIPNLETAYIYPGNCLFEGTNMSEGRGTALPFKQVGAPYIDAAELSQALNDLEMPGVKFRPAHFTPSTSKHKGELCAGVELYIDDLEVYKPLRVAVVMIYTIRDLYPEFKFRSVLPPSTNRFINLLSGSNMIFEAVEIEKLFSQYCQDEDKFRAEKRKYHLYR